MSPGWNDVRFTFHVVSLIVFLCLSSIPVSCDCIHDNGNVCDRRLSTKTLHKNGVESQHNATLQESPKVLKNNTKKIQPSKNSNPWHSMDVTSFSTHVVGL